MTDRYDALTVRESNGKSYFTKIGAMFANRNGEGYTLLLDAVPASNEGQYRIIITPPKPRDGERQASGGNQSRGSNRDDLDDDIAF